MGWDSACLASSPHPSPSECAVRGTSPVLRPLPCAASPPLWHRPISVLSPQGGVKVLITGPWQEASNNYSCLFDQISVPASLIQPGVLRCYCPGEEAVLIGGGEGRTGQ